MTGAVAATLVAMSTPRLLASAVSWGPGSGPLAMNDPGGGGGYGTTFTINCYGIAGTSATWDAGTFTESYDQGAMPSISIAYKANSSGLQFATATPAGTIVNKIGLSMRWRFVTAIEEIGTVATITGNGTLTIPGITATGTVLIAIIISEDGAGMGTSPASTTPTGFTSIVNGEASSGQLINVSYKQITAGATGDVTSAITGATYVTGGILMSIR